MPATLVARFGEAARAALFDASLEAIATLERLIADERIECEYERTGHIDAANKPSHFEAFREEQALLARVFDHRVELVPAAEQQRRDRHRRLPRPDGRRAERGAEPGAIRRAAGRGGVAAPARAIVEGAAVTAREPSAEDVDGHHDSGSAGAPATCWSRPTATPTAPLPGCSGGSCRSAATSSPPSR